MEIISDWRNFYIKQLGLKWSTIEDFQVDDDTTVNFS
jgi:hypothetical protein